MILRIKRAILAATTLALVAWPERESKAELALSSSEFANSEIVDFSQFNGPFQPQYQTGPVQVGGLIGRNIIWESTYGSSVIGSEYYGLGPNGSWDSGRIGFVGINVTSTSHSMTFHFLDGLVGAVGGLMNYVPIFGDIFIEALATDGTVLESFNLASLAPISTPGEINSGAFRGISRATADIAAFRVSGAFATLDNLTFGSGIASPVPEPTAWALGVMGATGCSAWARMRKARARA